MKESKISSIYIDEKTQPDIAESEYLNSLEFYAAIIEWADNDIFKASKRYVVAKLKAQAVVDEKLAEIVPSGEYATMEHFDKVWTHKVWTHYERIIREEIFDPVLAFKKDQLDLPAHLN